MHWQAQSDASRWCHKTYVYGSGGNTGRISHDSRITLRLSVDMLAGDTGCHEWEAGFLLSEVLLNNPSLIQGRLRLNLQGACSSKVLLQAAPYQ